MFGNVTSSISAFFSRPPEVITSQHVINQLGDPLLVVASSLPLLAVHVFPAVFPFHVSVAIAGTCLLGAIAVHLSYQSIMASSKGQSMNLSTFTSTTRTLFYRTVKYFNMINTTLLFLLVLQKANLIAPLIVSSPLITAISIVIGISLFLIASTLKHYFPKQTNPS
jgi:hypothetical protein